MIVTMIGSSFRYNLYKSMKCRTGRGVIEKWPTSPLVSEAILGTLLGAKRGDYEKL